MLNKEDIKIKASNLLHLHPKYFDNKINLEEIYRFINLPDDASVTPEFIDLNVNMSRYAINIETVYLNEKLNNQYFKQYKNDLFDIKNFLYEKIYSNKQLFFHLFNQLKLSQLLTRMLIKFLFFDTDENRSQIIKFIEQKISSQESALYFLLKLMFNTKLLNPLPSKNVANNIEIQPNSNSYSKEFKGFFNGIYNKRIQRENVIAKVLSFFIDAIMKSIETYRCLELIVHNFKFFFNCLTPSNIRHKTKVFNVICFLIYITYRYNNVYVLGKQHLGKENKEKKMKELEITQNEMDTVINIYRLLSNDTHCDTYDFIKFLLK